MTTIRAIGPDDWRAFREVRIAALTDSPTAFGATLADTVRHTDAEWQDLVGRRTQSATSGIWLAETGNEGDRQSADGPAGGATAGGAPVGVIAADLDPTLRIAEVTSMWVAPSARGTGLARRLVAVAVGWAADAGADAVALWVTRGNAAAHRLYETCGFVETGDHQPLPSDPCKDEVRMTLTL